MAAQSDLVIFDINMPVLGGFAAAKEIQRLMPQTRISFLTIHVGEQFASEARKAGVKAL
jgi:DNA-binding NarL/FixJ family response regulator